MYSSNERWSWATSSVSSKFDENGDFINGDLVNALIGLVQLAVDDMREQLDWMGGEIDRTEADAYDRGLEAGKLAGAKPKPATTKTRKRR